MSTGRPPPRKPNPNRPTTDEPSADSVPDVFVLGGAHLGRAVARQLGAAGHAVGVVDETHDPSESPGGRGDPADVAVLAEAGVADASTVVVATGRDRRNLLVAQLVRAHFDVPRVVVLSNDPDRLDPIADAGHDAVCATTALTEALVDRL